MIRNQNTTTRTHHTRFPHGKRRELQLIEFIDERLVMGRILGHILEEFKREHGVSPSVTRRWWNHYLEWGESPTETREKNKKLTRLAKKYKTSSIITDEVVSELKSRTLKDKVGYSLQVCYNAVRELGNRSKVIKFVPRRTESVYISVIPGSGCWSFVGRIGGRQELSLTSCGCFSKGTIQHEFMHAIGMSHEQTCPDRDRYIRINWGNIQGGRASSNLKKNRHQLRTG